MRAETEGSATTLRGVSTQGAGALGRTAAGVQEEGIKWITSARLEELDGLGFQWDVQKQAEEAAWGRGG